MNFAISSDRKSLTIAIDAEERTELREASDIHSDIALADFLEPITCNSELDWVDSSETGDLTDAPMLGICEHSKFPRVVRERWAWMSYQVKSLLEELRDKGSATLIGGN